MNMFTALYAIIIVYVSAFLFENYQKIETAASAVVSELGALQIANLWAYVMLGVIYLNIVYVFCKVMLRRGQTADKAKLEQI